jgi:hypothetical protein
VLLTTPSASEERAEVRTYCGDRGAAGLISLQSTDPGAALVPKSRSYIWRNATLVAAAGPSPR